MEFDIAQTNFTQINSDFNKELVSIPIEDANHLTYQEFFINYMQTNTPCVIKHVASNWQSTHKWTTNGKPNLSYLNQKYKDTKVIIYNCSERYFNSQKCTEGTLEEYLRVLEENEDNNLYYLKDWHLKLQRRNDDFYQVPIYFASDWLNEYFLACSDDDYRFVYMGQKGTWTPLHSDVFNSYSWSVNVCGQKKWIFFPPDEENHLKDPQNNLIYDISEIKHTRKSYEVIQQSGEAIFVPSGWYHQVWNLQDTISINHNWINGLNVHLMWQNMGSNLKMIKKEIEDCKGMDNFEGHCQIMLKSLFGLNFKEFYDLLTFICTKRMDMLKNNCSKQLFHGHIISIDHILFDLWQIYKVLKQFLSCDDIISDTNFSKGESLLNQILVILKNRNILN